jgi:hypothetical protein
MRKQSKQEAERRTTMYDNHAALAEADQSVEAIAAELTVAAYRVSLSHAARDSWIELEIELWRALTDALKKVRRLQPPPRLAHDHH